MAIIFFRKQEVDLQMFSDRSATDFAIQVSGISKCYHIYNSPRDRLKQFIAPWGGALFGLKEKKYFREFWAVHDVTFELKKGESLAIVGRNGSGKSTLLQMISGTLTPTSGAVKVSGRVVALLELGSGFNPEFTGIENVFLNGAIHGLSRESIENKIDQVAAFADIGDFMSQPVKTYSSGMYARLAFSASMFLEPDILIVDEILAVGDAPFQAKCMQAFHKLRDNGCSVIMVSHDQYMVKNFCQKALYLRKGDCIGFGDSTTIIDEYSLEIEKAQAVLIKNNNDQESHSANNLEFSVGSSFEITSVELLGENNLPTTLVRTGQTLTIRFRFKVFGENPPKITFVVNLYRHDGLYICGTTTLMDNLSPFSPGCDEEGMAQLTFHNIRLLAGRYVWRVAINDEKAFAAYVEANQVCSFDVIDSLEAVGLINLDRVWSVSICENN